MTTFESPRAQRDAYNNPWSEPLHPDLRAPLLPDAPDRGRALLAHLEAAYRNGLPDDNLTDALADLLHAGMPEDDIRHALRNGVRHYRAELTDGDA